MKSLRKIALLSTLLAAPLTQAQDSGFLTSYDNLSTPADIAGFASAYVAPGAFDTVAKYNQIMVDQPEIIIAEDSKYRGAKPQDILEVSEALRSALIDGIGGRFPVVNAPGEGAALMSWAVSNIYLKKRKRGILGYTPVGAVAYGARNLASEAVDKTRAYDVVFEFEATDSTTGEVLMAGVVNLGEAGEEVEFESALALANGIGQRIGCRLNNSRLVTAEREDCTGISLAMPEE
ncbi:MAG: DUF3313 family protein [Pseudomonadota bacterium]